MSWEALDDISSGKWKSWVLEALMKKREDFGPAIYLGCSHMKANYSSCSQHEYRGLRKYKPSVEKAERKVEKRNWE